MGGVHQYGFYPCKDISLGNEIKFLGPSIEEHSGFKKRNVRKVETLRTGGDIHACMHAFRSPLPENAFVSDIQSHRYALTQVKRQEGGSYWTQSCCLAKVL